MPFTYDPARGFPRVVPLLLYDDPTAALDWLVRVFGFSELLRVAYEDGSVGHADLGLEGGIVTLGGPAPADDRGATRASARVWVLVYVGDVDGHFERTRAGGAAVLEAPEDKPWGLRQYRVEDLEGHVWEFTQHLRDVPPADWGAVEREHPTTQEDR